MDSKTKKIVTGSGVVTILGIIIAWAGKANGVLGFLDRFVIFISKPWFTTIAFPVLVLVLLAVLTWLFWTSRAKLIKSHADTSVIYESTCQKLESDLKEKPTTIALFLPLEDAGTDAKKDGESQLNGVVKFLKKENCLTRHIHLNVYDHSLPKVEAQNYNLEERKRERLKRLCKLVEEEYIKGTRYFFCTMSQVCEPFVPEFIKWSQTKSDAPRLICTVAAAPLKLNNINTFRYYPRSEDEVALLVDKMRQRQIKKVIPIEVNSAFGEKTREELRAQCAGEPTILGIKKLKGNETVLEIQEFLNNQIAEHHASEKDTCFFLVLYGESLTRTVEALNTISCPLKIFSVSTLTTECAAKKSFRKEHEWVTCVPRLKNNETFSDDVISYFVYVSLRRFAKTIICVKDQGKFFQDVWVDNHEHPPAEHVEWESKGQGFDSKITMVEKVIT